MVPEGWDVLPLGEIAEFRNGLNFTKDDDGQIVKVVTIPDFWRRTILRDFSDVKIIQCKGKVPETSFLKSGDLLFVRSNGNPELVGRCLFFPQVLEPISFSGFTIRGRMDVSRILPEFAASVMVTDRTKNQFRRGRGGGNISNLSQDILAGVQVALPPLPEQRKIAEILSVWDRAIEVSEALLATATAQKRSLMQSLLTGHRRFPEFKGQAWKEVRLGEVVASIRGGGTPDKSKPEYWNGNIPWVSVKDLKADRLTTTIDSITEMGLQNSAANAFDAGTVIISTRMAVGVTVKLGARMAINQDLKAILPASVIRSDYIFHCLQMNQPKLEALGTGSTVKGITLGVLRGLEIGYPSCLEEQDSIVRVIESASNEATALMDNIRHLRTEKKALMQQLLTGKRRVVV